jgi:hypothetical protein
MPVVKHDHRDHEEREKIMEYIGVHATVDGADIKSKKVLKELVKAGDGQLRFRATSPFNHFNGGLSALTSEVTLVIHGPNPYTSRKWDATIKIDAKGAFKVA